MFKSKFFKIDKSYKTLYNMIAERYSIAKAEKIFKEAEDELEKLYVKFANVPKGERDHTHRYIFPRAAIYRAMKEEMNSDAMPLIDKLIYSEGKKAGEMMRKITALPFMKSVFLRIFSFAAKEQFGEKKGFKQTFYQTPKNTVKFDILDCPYCRYCRECGCPELIHTFCDSDAYCFGNLSKIEFKREYTLENNERCDFSLTIVRK